MNIKCIIELHEDTKDPDNRRKYVIRQQDYILEKLRKKIEELKIPEQEITGVFKYVTEYTKYPCSGCTPWITEDYYFTAWSDKYVFVIGTYDGGDWIETVPRNITNDVIAPIGGG